ncbi:TonB-dependent receptor [Paralimibaculum aggregatum]|uniref:TonB-dependent receptor n=2 Tax=Paralimibaculum aggregatum TaxID=3036245 RepID=A0ABQ6LU41_9RHOB|nr:TonB-dependent receptor [Limibaculum sp. NKW23]
MQRRPHLAAALAIAPALAAAAAAAQEPLVLDELLVTGGRTPIGVTETGRAYTVITGDQLAAQGARYVSDALRQVPGVAVSRGGSLGGLTQIRVRGAESNQVLVLIDGVEVAPAGNGELDFGSLVVADIERIEVLRGPQSALFGSNAAAGVIQIITRRGRRDDLAFRARVEGGSDGTALATASLAGGGDTWDAAFSASMRRADGFNIATGFGDREGEMDGDMNLTLNAKGNWDLTEDFALGGVIRYVDRNSETDDQSFPFPADATSGFVIDSDDVNESRDVSLGLFARYEMLDDALVHQLRFDFTDNYSDALSDGASTFRNESRRYKGSYQGSYAFETGPVSHLVTGLAEYEQEENEATTARQSRTLFGLAGEYRGSIGGFDLQAGLRNDFNDEFEDALTFSVSGSYTVAPTGTRLHGSVGRGVTNPTFFEQFGFSPDFFIGNPSLEPERTFMWDLGVEQPFLDGRLVLDATYFRGKVTDEIISGFDADAGLTTSVNATGESPRQGVELALTAFPTDALSITASYTYTLAEEGSTGRQEVRRPRHMAALDVTWGFLDGRGRLNVNAAYNGEQRDLDFSDGFFGVQPLVTLDDYVLLSVQGSYKVTENVELYARIENAANVDYQEVYRFETQGVAGFAGIRLEF